MKGRKSDYVILGLFLLFLYGIAAANLFTKDRLFPRWKTGCWRRDRKRS